MKKMATTLLTTPTNYPEPTQRCISAARARGVEVFTTIFESEVPTAQV